MDAQRGAAHMQNWPTGQHAPGNVSLRQAPYLTQVPVRPPHWSKGLSMNTHFGCVNCVRGGALTTAAAAAGLVLLSLNE